MSFEEFVILIFVGIIFVVIWAIVEINVVFIAAPVISLSVFIVIV